ncbi:MAG: UDP-N-acetylmuramate dehydrogenase [Planctomycetales bacterium]|nr:UDP-N-acetylmuramate dehydrogenase [Planctomycetales bacterium]
MTFLTGLESFVREEESLAPYTWFKIGGPAQYFAEPTSVEDLTELVGRCRENDVPVRLLGGGSNLLVREAGVPGVVVHLSHPCFAEIKHDGRKITAGGGARLNHVISTSVREGLAGLEPLVGIPGTIGGALHGNAGSRGGDIGQFTAAATVMTRSGELIQREREELVFAYRQSSLDELVIVDATFELEEDDPEQLTKRMQKQWIIKKASQPMAHQSAGCIFKNPRDFSAGKLIEQCGLKGVRAGGAEVCQTHANFIIAHEDATSDDVLQLIDQVRRSVADRHEVELELEIEIW